MIYTSRFSNPAVRISVGSPRWKVGYDISGAISELMPKGIFGKYETKAAFEVEYRKRLECIGTAYIRKLLAGYETLGKDVVLLCYEDVRKGESDWCHRTIDPNFYRSPPNDFCGLVAGKDRRGHPGTVRPVSRKGRQESSEDRRRTGYTV